MRLRVDFAINGTRGYTPIIRSGFVSTTAPLIEVFETALNKRLSVTIHQLRPVFERVITNPTFGVDQTRSLADLFPHMRDLSIVRIDVY
ncbi:MAG: hypothetical protein MRY21_07495 [Simkaniaceae bacterium]|nr:hypothetical protein [Simkaniaceae bacterium]